MSTADHQSHGNRAHVVELREAAKTYPGPPPVHALRPTSVTVASGEYVAVVGPSGSGKSTLLNLLGLLDTPSDGEYLLDGLQTSTLNEDERTALRGREIGFVFQDFQLLPHRTAEENVALGLLYGPSGRAPVAERRATARAALERVGLSHRIQAMPTKLSGGERQRVAIARALVTSPRLLLCDEPTGNLDTVTAARILDLFDALHADGATILVITHDATTAARAQRTISIRDGGLRDGPA